MLRFRLSCVMLPLGTTVLLLACNNTPPPTPPETPPAPEPDVEAGMDSDPEPLETNRECANAEAECDSGICKTVVKNGCDSAITCNVVIMALCQSSTTSGESRGKARGTIPAGKSDTLTAIADCEGSSITATMVESFECK